MHVEPWVRLVSHNEETCTSDDIVAFTWKSRQPSDAVDDSTSGALVVEFTRRRTENAVYRYNDVTRSLYKTLRQQARTQDAETFEEFFNNRVRNSAAGEDYVRKPRA